MEVSAPTMSEILGSSVAIPEKVVYRRFAAETVVLNLETAKYHGLNPTAGHMLETMGRAATVEAAVSELADELAVPIEEIRKDICELCVGLEARGLIRLERSSP